MNPVLPAKVSKKPPAENLDKFNEGKDSLKKAFVEFVELSKVEQEKLVKSLPLYKVKSWDGLVTFCLEKPSNALNYLIRTLESWILPFIDSLEDGDELVKNSKLFSDIHKMLLRMMSNLDTHYFIENCLPKRKWSFLSQKVLLHERAKRWFLTI